MSCAMISPRGQWRATCQGAASVWKKPWAKTTQVNACIATADHDKTLISNALLAPRYYIILLVHVTINYARQNINVSSCWSSQGFPVSRYRLCFLQCDYRYWRREIPLRKVINNNETQGISRISPDPLGGVWTRDYLSPLRLCYVCMYCLTDVMHVTKSPWPSAYPLRFCIILLSKNGGGNGLGTRLQLQS